jgi:hypothetical protein|nr:MAG: hypothetical protein [Lake Baikal virophage 15]
MNPIEFELNGAKLKVYNNGEVWRFGYLRNSKKEKWIQLKGNIKINKDGYKNYRTLINQKQYVTSRIIYKAFNLEWDITNTKNNEIDHINRDSLDNRIENLRVANKKEQNLNKDCVINARGYYFRNDKYQAQIRNNRKATHLGTFDTAEEAHNAYLVAVKKYRN